MFDVDVKILMNQIRAIFAKGWLTDLEIEVIKGKVNEECTTGGNQNTDSEVVDSDERNDPNEDRIEGVEQVLQESNVRKGRLPVDSPTLEIPNENELDEERREIWRNLKSFWLELKRGKYIFISNLFLYYF